MGIDKTTEPNYVNVIIEDNAQYLKELRQQAEDDDQNSCVKEGESKKLSLTKDKHSFDMEEYYFDESDNNLVISGEMISSKGKSYIYLSIPLSDVVLIDILAYSLKKLNKLKTAMETLK